VADRGPRLALRRAFCAFAVFALGPALAQAETRNEFWPELDAYLKLSDRARVFLLASTTSASERHNAAGVTAYQDSELGAHLDITLTPIFRPALMNADWERDRYLWMRVGYARLGALQDSPDSSDENRGIFELNARNPLPPSTWLFGRFRWEARDVEGQHSNRYRIRLGAEREVTWFERVAVPYVTAETYYDTRYDQWSRQQYKVGAEIAIDDRWRIEPYFARRNDQRSEPAHVNAIGLALKYYR